MQPKLTQPPPPPNPNPKLPSPPELTHPPLSPPIQILLREREREKRETELGFCDLNFEIEIVADAFGRSISSLSFKDLRMHQVLVQLA